MAGNQHLVLMIFLILIAVVVLPLFWGNSLPPFVGAAELQKLYCIISVSGQGNVVCDNSNDTLTFVAGPQMLITTDPTTDSVNFTSIGGVNNTGANVGGGAGVFRDSTAEVLNFRSLLGLNGITVTQNANDITLNASGIPKTSISSSGTFPWAEISKSGSILNDIGSPTGSYGFNSQIITSYGVPVSNTDVQRVDKLQLKNLTGDCANNQVLQYQSSNSTWICANAGSGITSINGDTTAAQVIAGQSGNITVSDVGATHTIGLGINPVITGGSAQTITKGLTTNALTFGGNVAGGNFLITGYGTPASSTDAQRVNRLGLHDLTIGDCADGSPIEYQTSNSTFICGTDGGGASGITSVSNQDPNADAKLVGTNGTTFATIKGLNGTSGQISIANGSSSAIISLIPKFNNQTCSGTDKFSSYSNVTGIITCTTDIDTNSGGNVTNLNDAGDVSITSPLDNDFLRFDGAFWVNEAIALATGNATMLNDLGDVIISSPAYQHMIYYNGTHFVNRAFSVNNQTVQNDFQVVGINNATGTITTNQFSVNLKTCSSTDKVSAIDNATGDVTCTADVDTTNTGNATNLNELGDVSITSVAIDHILQYDGAFWINKLFKIDNQTAQPDFQIIGINNQTGDITTNQFSINTNTCAVGDFVSSIDNATGLVTCTTPSAGAGNATVLDNLGDVHIQSPTSGQVLTYNGTYWNNTASAGGATDRIFEGDSEVEVIDLGTGFVEVGIDGLMDYNFTLNYFNMSTNELNFKNNSMPAKPPAGNIQIYAMNSTNNTGSSSPATLYAIDDLGFNYTLQDMPRPFFKKMGLVTPAATAGTDGLFGGAVLDGTETAAADNTFGGHISTTTGTTIGGDAGVRTASGLVWQGAYGIYLDAKIQLQGAGGYDTFIGFNSDVSTSALAGTSVFCNSDACAGIGIRANTDTQWKYVVNDADATADFFNTGITNSTTTALRVQIWSDPDNGNRWCFRIDTNDISCFTTEVPAPTTPLGAITSISTVDVTSDTFRYYYVYSESRR